MRAKLSPLKNRFRSLSISSLLPVPKEHRAFLAILLTNFLVLVATTLHPELIEKLALKQSTLNYGSVWAFLFQCYSHFFTHANWEHFFGNFFYVFPFALYLERKVGSQKFFLYWILCGFSSAFFFITMPHASLFGWGSLVGSSGACYGIVTAAFLLYDDHTLLRAVGGLVAVLIFLPQLRMAVVDSGALVPMPVAFWAHVGGAIAGAFFAHYLRPE